MHVEQAWERWVNTHKNEVYHVKDEVLARLRGIAHAATPSMYKEAVRDLKASSIWKTSKKLQNYIEGKWLPAYTVNSNI